MADTGKKDRKETIGLVVKTLATLFLCETVVMILLHVLAPEVPRSTWDIIVDPVLMLGLSAPILYWVLVKPMWSTLRERTRAVDDLQQCREHLEEQVQSRTSELTEANRQLRTQIDRRIELEREILSVSERERQRIGQELHDSIGQQLTGIEFMMEVLGERLAGKASAQETLYAGKISTYVGQTVEMAHNLAKGLAPIDLDRDGLLPVLQELTARTAQIFNVSCAFTCDPSVSVSGIPAPINVYRIAQEAVTNAVKHGQARNIELRLSGENGSTVLTVANDGLDFPAEPYSVAGMGLRIMRYRAELMNGVLDIGRGIQGGTLVRCVLPRPEVSLREKGS